MIGLLSTEEDELKEQIKKAILNNSEIRNQFNPKDQSNGHDCI